MKFKDEVLFKHPSWPLAKKILETLKSHGFEAVLAGGCVRDGFLNRLPKDLDIATSAEPDQVEKLFSKTISVGKSFGVIRVIEDHFDLEVASFRFDGQYIDGRRPDSVQWTTAEQDALRRDFTINALFYDPLEQKVYDYVDGLKDIEARTIRCVGDPRLRFQEDHLRILRAVRFMSELNFVIDPKTWQSVQELSHLVKSVSRERIRDEVLKLLKSDHTNLSFEKLIESGLLQNIDEELYKIIKAKGKSPQIKWKDSEVQIWTQYFLWVPLNTLEQEIDLYKLPKEQKRFIQKSLSYYNQKEELASWSLGRKLYAYQELEFVWALNLISQERSWIWIERLKEEVFLRGLDKGFPAKLLRGEDIPKDVPPNRRGQFLDEAYQHQLEKQWTTREQVFQYLNKNEESVEDKSEDPVSGQVPSTWRRLLARFIDQCFKFILGLPFWWQLFRVLYNDEGIARIHWSWIVYFIFVYVTYEVASFYIFGATLGKWICDLKLVPRDAHFKELGLAQCFLRVLLSELSLFFGWTLYVSAFFYYDRSHWIDRWAETRLICVKSNQRRKKVYPRWAVLLLCFCFFSGVGRAFEIIQAVSYSDSYFEIDESILGNTSDFEDLENIHQSDHVMGALSAFKF